MAFYNNADMYKAITVETMQHLLQELPSDSLLCVNDVGNLAILVEEGSEHVFYGFIDFVEETVVL